MINIFFVKIAVLFTKIKVADEYVNFYENRYRIMEKYIYHRKYHIENVLNA